ncbi:Uncharacterised protein [Chlamydia abortus]|nr:Uncharacterised protein [Chlamydia abortus]
MVTGHTFNYHVLTHLVMLAVSDGFIDRPPHERSATPACNVLHDQSQAHSFPLHPSPYLPSTVPLVPRSGTSHA